MRRNTKGKPMPADCYSILAAVAAVAILVFDAWHAVNVSRQLCRPVLSIDVLIDVAILLAIVGKPLAAVD
jgi:hypothetical protein